MTDQPQKIDHISFMVPYEFKDAICECIIDLTDSITCFETPDLSKWEVNIYNENKTDLNQIIQRLENISSLANFQFENFKSEEIDNINWVLENQKSFKPIKIGKIFIHPSFYKESINPSLIPIQIDAGVAFGTASHETTSGCIEALNKLFENDFKPQNILDMGCGTGILAIVASKLWPNANIIASDIDPQAVTTANDNIIINNCSDQITTTNTDGFSKTIIAQKFDLIIANILELPLIIMAEQLFNSLNSDGHAILSGYYIEQESKVLSTYTKLGFSDFDRFYVNKWSANILKK